MNGKTRERIDKRERECRWGTGVRPLSVKVEIGIEEGEITKEVVDMVVEEEEDLKVEPGKRHSTDPILYTGARGEKRPRTMLILPAVRVRLVRANERG